MRGHQRALAFGDLEILPDAGWCDVGYGVSLAKTEFGFLCELAQAPGRILTREILLEKVWGYDYFGDGRLVDVHIRRLRTKVEANPAYPRHIVTIRDLATSSSLDGAAVGRRPPAGRARSLARSTDGCGAW